MNNNYTINFCTFSNKNFGVNINPEFKGKAINRIYQQAKNFGIFNKIFCLNEDNLDSDFKQSFKQILKDNIRGFGYWCWKPRIILDCLEQLNDGDILVYADCGCFLNNCGLERFKDYIELVKKSKQKRLLTLNRYVEKDWTKGDIFDYFNCRNNIEITLTNQIQSGFLIIEKNKENLYFIQDWMDIYYDNIYLILDTPSKSKNLPGFKENRHDQSIVSMLIKNKYPSILIHDFECRKTNDRESQNSKLKPILFLGLRY